MTLQEKLFGFRGRVRRQDWWWLNILVGIAQIVTMFALASVMSIANLASSATPLPPFDALASLPLYVRIPIQLAFLWPTLALSAQRFHDRGWSAWPIFAYYAVLYGVDYLEAATGWIIGFDPAEPSILFIVWAVLWIGLAIGLFVVLGFLDGTQGPNKYGPSPKGIGAASPAAVFD